jgi:predicted CoA-binding protein
LRITAGPKKFGSGCPILKEIFRLINKHELYTMFFPRSIAVVGASPNPKGWGGTNFVLRLRDLEFPGKIYPVNPKATEILGFKTYPKVSSIPEPVDLVIVAIAAQRVPQVLEDCITAGVKNVHIFASGFSETGEEEGRTLERPGAWSVFQQDDQFRKCQWSSGYRFPRLSSYGPGYRYHHDVP